MTRHFAVIDPASPRAAAWRKLYGRDWIEVESPEPFAGWDDGLPRPCYRAKVSAFTPEERGRLCALLAVLWEATPEEVAVEMDAGEGLPVASHGVRICRDPAEGRAWFAGRRAAS